MPIIYDSQSDSFKETTIIPLADLEAQITQKQSQIQTLNDRISDCNNTITQLNQEISDLQTLIAQRPA